MALIFKDWLNTNEQRNYPLHDNCTRRAANGTELPNDIIVDASIWFPKTAGTNLVVSSVGVSEKLITLTLAAVAVDPLFEAPDANFVPVAVLKVLRPHIPYKNYAIEAFYHGVGGWIALGQCTAVESVNCLFTDPAAAVLLDRTVHAYDALPVISLGRQSIAAKLTGVVYLKGTPGQVRTFAMDRIIGGENRRVAAIGLDDTQPGNSVLETFAGTCGHRPESKNCILPPIESINEIKPDCDGNLNIEFVDPFFVGALVPGGLIIDNPIGLGDVCQKKNPFNQPQPSDSSNCENEKQTFPTAPPPPVEPPYTNTSLSLSSSSDLETQNYCLDFAGPVGPVTEYQHLTRGMPPIVPGYDWSVELINGVYFLATPLGSMAEEYLINREAIILLPVSMIVVLTMTVRLGGQQQNAALVFGHDGSSSYGFRFFGLSIGNTEAHPNGKFVFGFRYAKTGETPIPDVSFGSGWHYDPDESSNGYIYDPEVPLEANIDYIVQLTITRSGHQTVIQPKVTWYDSHGVFHTFEPLVPFFVPVLVEGFAGIGGVATDALFSHFGINC